MNLAPIPNYEGLYLIGSDGSVYSVPRRGNINKTHKLAGGVDSCGYRIVILTKGGKQKTCRVHRLVAEAFIPNPNNFREINHKDEDKNNNAVENLEWCDRKYNVCYGRRTEKTRKAVMQFDKSGSFLKTFDGVKIAADAVGARTCGGISNCCNGKSKSAYGFIWRWAN